MPSAKHNLTMDKAIGFISSLFNVASALGVLFAIDSWNICSVVILKVILILIFVLQVKHS